MHTSDPRARTYPRVGTRVRDARAQHIEELLGAPGQMCRRVVRPAADDAEAPCIRHTLIVARGVRRRVHICPGAVRLALKRRKSEVGSQYGVGASSSGSSSGHRRVVRACLVSQANRRTKAMLYQGFGCSGLEDMAIACGSGRLAHLPASAVFDVGYVEDLREYSEGDVPELVGHAEEWDDGIRTCDAKYLQRLSRPSAHSRSCTRNGDAPCHSRLYPLAFAAHAERVRRPHQSSRKSVLTCRLTSNLLICESISMFSARDPSKRSSRKDATRWETILGTISVGMALSRGILHSYFADAEAASAMFVRAVCARARSEEAQANARAVEAMSRVGVRRLPGAYCNRPHMAGQVVGRAGVA